MLTRTYDDRSSGIFAISKTFEGVQEVAERLAKDYGLRRNDPAYWSGPDSRMEIDSYEVIE